MYTRFRLVPIWMTLDDLEWQLEVRGRADVRPPGAANPSAKWIYLVEIPLAAMAAGEWVRILPSTAQRRLAGAATNEAAPLARAAQNSTLFIYRAVKCRLIWHFWGQALLLRVVHVVAGDNVRDCVFLKDDLNRVKKGLNSYELNFRYQLIHKIS